jgi:lysophospholipase L1-like esterase
MGGNSASSGGRVESSGGSEASGGATNSGGTTSSGGSSSTGGADPAGPIQVWLAGDSTVAGGNTPCPRGWGRHFAEEFDDRVTVINSAAGGRSVRTWLYNVTTTMGTDGECVLQLGSDGKPTLQARWDDMLKNMKAGDYLFVQFGINDGSSTCDRHVGLETFKNEYAMMAEAARTRGAHPVFVTPVSAIACTGSTAIGSRGAFVDATIQVGQAEDVPVIDLHALSIQRYQELNFCPVPGGDVSASTTGPVGDYFCDDHTHFSEAGSIDIARLVADALRDQDIGLREYLKP